MRRRTLEPTLIGGAVVMLAVAALRWQRSAPAETAPKLVALARTQTRPVTDSLLAESEALAVENDLFRLSNAPPDVRFDPRDEGSTGRRVVAFAPPRPSFALRGITGGPPWQAVVDGVPGQPPGVVVREGERFDKLVIRTVTRDSVIIQGPDTAWVLRFGARP
jgi:hypothetical protein